MPVKKINSSLLIFFVFAIKLSFAQTETESTHDNFGNGTGTQVGAANVNAGTTQVPIYGLGFSVSSGSPSFSAVTFTTSGTYVAGDIANFKLWECNFDVFPSGTAVQRGSTITTTLGPGSHTFSGLGITISTGSFHCFYITVDIAAGATGGHTIICNQITKANTTITGTNTYGTNLTGGTQTITGGLPVELYSFTGKKSGNKNILEWITASESNNDFFTLEHSTDGASFSELINVPGAGDSHTTLDYSTEDTEPYSPITYYRLKQTDFDGKFTYSNTIAVSTESYIVYTGPNPVNDNFSIKLISDDIGIASLEILDVTGAIILKNNFQESKGENSIQLNVNTFSPGLYFIRLHTSSIQEQLKFVKL